jgi:hypothetical protein
VHRWGLARHSRCGDAITTALPAPHAARSRFSRATTADAAAEGRAARAGRWTNTTRGPQPVQIIRRRQPLGRRPQGGRIYVPGARCRALCPRSHPPSDHWSLHESNSESQKHTQIPLCIPLPWPSLYLSAALIIACKA